MNMALRRQYLVVVLMLSAACYLQLLLIMQQTDFNPDEEILKSVRLPGSDGSRQPSHWNISGIKEEHESDSLYRAATPSINAIVNNLNSRNNTMLIQRKLEGNFMVKRPSSRGNSMVIQRKPEGKFMVRRPSSRGNSMVIQPKPNGSSMVNVRESRSNFMLNNTKNVTLFKTKPHVLDRKLRELDAKSVLLKEEIHLQKTQDAQRITKTLSHRCHRKVHLWATRAGELGFSGGQHLIRCPRSVCDVQLTVDMDFETMQNNEALVLFHWSHWDWDKMHSHRPPGQKWVFYTLESPRHTRPIVIPPNRYYNTSYDYIMTYRYDSDFRADYGQYRPGKPEIDPADDRNWAQNRTKLVAWMASNCQRTSWPREDFVERLARHIPVDMYGRCGNLTCKAGTKACDRTLRQYKFYLALENSECTDYITEKFWIQSFLRELVPIVFGPPRSDYEKVAPPNSFIHIQDFRTTKELADYLQRVDNDDALYNTYFQWKKVGSLKPYGTEPNIMCQLGDRLEADERALQDGTYVPSKQKDWIVWWKESCKRKGEIPK